MQFGHAVLFLRQRIVEQLTDIIDEVRGQVQRLVVVDDGLLYLVDRQVREVAYAILSSATQEIAVAVSGPVRRFGVDEARCPLVAFAAVAEQDALEVVLEYSVALSALAAERNYFLDALKEHRVDDRFVSSGVDLTLVDNAAHVVAVLQHPMEPLECNGSFGKVTCCACGEPEVGHSGFKPLKSVLTSGIQLKSPAHQRSTFGVELNRVDQPSFMLHTRVKVAERRLAGRSAVFCLVLQLDSDVFAAELVLDVIEDVSDGLHHVGVDTVTEVFTGGDEFDVELVQQPFGDGGVDIVAKGTRTGVDNDVAHIGVFPQERQHLLERLPLLDSGRGDARLDELAHDICTQAAGFAAGNLPLCSNGIAVRVDVDGSVHLLLTRHPKVENSLGWLLELDRPTHKSALLWGAGALGAVVGVCGAAAGVGVAWAGV
ncbi:Uncharacterised protein [Mycobacteroides abscessus subsp. massiliense]|nr:Uncharacterised protein [Mycobacteroides abscessus subsp. massiliense]SKJ21297.1 Uncharacterised protein [Mycobacteroides abscessus subsp. massiliense]SKK56664.1 Uncharacterised protein [Mycobacteroides abscessus subsp. massiliense]SLC89093.1 Uncharacterised protein [Mycobacteroides abscessus subsp. massiliense]